MGITLDFTGKTVLVIGAGRGLGKSIALMFADCGADVYIGSRNTAQCEQAVEELKAKGVRAGYTKCDVAVPGDVEKLTADAVSFGGGKLDVVINAAGVMSMEDILYTSAPEMSRLLNINVVGTANVIKYALGVMRPQKSGVLLLLSSVAGRGGGTVAQVYGASKAAVISLTQSAAKMVAAEGIRVNSIAPGIIHTEMWDEILMAMANGWKPGGRRDFSREELDALWKASVESTIPTKTAQTEEDIAWGTVFLASDYARQITGQTLAIDGGITMV